MVLNCPVLGSGMIQNRKNIGLVSESLLKDIVGCGLQIGWFACQRSAPVGSFAFSRN